MSTIYEVEEAMSTLVLPSKSIRAKVIKEHGIKRCICFTCGNCAQALRNEGIDVVEVGNRGLIKPTRWLTLKEIYQIKGDLFDATSGHLSIPMMVEIGNQLKKYLGHLKEKFYYLPTGSGETLVCLSMVYPKVKFRAVYGTKGSIRFNKEAPLNKIVGQFAVSKEYVGGDKLDDWMEPKIEIEVPPCK